MTISTTTDTEFTVGQIVTLAFQRAGLLNVHLTPNVQQSAYARKELELVLDGLTRRGISAYAVTFENVTLVPGTYRYQMGVSTENVVGDAALIEPDETVAAADGETRIQQVRRQEWHDISSKSSTSRPTLFYVDRTTVRPYVVLWPIPDLAYTARFQVHRRLADVQDGNATVDLQTYWHDYLVAELAHVLLQAHNIPAPRVAMFKALADEKFREARRHAGQTPPQRAVLNHRTAWSR